MSKLNAKLFAFIGYSPAQAEKEAAYASAAKYLPAAAQKKLRKTMGLDKGGVTKAEAQAILKAALAALDGAPVLKGKAPKVAKASKSKPRKIRSEAQVAKDREVILKAIATAQAKSGFATTGNVKVQVKDANFANDMAAMLKEGVVTTKPITADERAKLTGVAAAKTKSTLHVARN